MNRQFHLTHTVRYDECDCEGLLTPTAFLRCMQEVAARDAKDARLGGEGYWVIRRTVMTFAAPLPVHTNLELKTYGIGFTRITAQRGYEAYQAATPSNGALASASTLWVFVDPRGRPTRLPELTAETWLPDGVRPPKPEPPFPAAPSDPPLTTTTVVQFSQIDLMHHLNYAATVEMLDDAGWEELAAHEITPARARLAIRRYDIDYGDSPRFGDRLEIQSWFEPLLEEGREFTRFQRIMRAGKTMIQARSYWFWQAEQVG